MSNTKYDFGVFIGRFAPIHDGHLKVIQEALEKCDYLIVVVGSNNMARNTRTPFTASERMKMIRIATNNDKRILLNSVGDFPYNEPIWLSDVQSAVDESIKSVKNLELSYNGWRDYKYNIALAGMHKDETSYYLNSFPQWSNSIAIDPETLEGEIHSSTGIRNLIFNGALDYAKNIDARVRHEIHNIMDRHHSEWVRLKSDWDEEQKYESIYGKGPHTTGDACVIQAGHILLIQRGQSYGQGLWALPGGFLNRPEKIINCIVRELREETKLKVPDKVLHGSIKAVKVFDDPYRSNRSRIITHCAKFVLDNVKDGLPKVMGSDDAQKAKWITISKLDEMSGTFFEDHESIIHDMLTA